MSELMKVAVFERLAAPYNENLQVGKWNRHNGYEELAHDSMHQNYGIEASLEALGYDVVEFRGYAREIRRKDKRQA
jgi:hypothetical protein